MPLDNITRAVLEEYTATLPDTEHGWYGSWTTILTSLFPATQGYHINPQQLISGEDHSKVLPLPFLFKFPFMTASGSEPHVGLRQTSPFHKANRLAFGRRHILV